MRDHGLVRPLGVVLAVALIALAGCDRRPGTQASARPPAEVQRPAVKLVNAAAVTTPSAPVTAVPSAEPAQPDRREAPIPGKVVTNGLRDSKMVALTFDLCATPQARSGFDAKLVQTLVDQAAPATFFMGGLWAIEHPEAARSLASNARFEIANHGYAHIHAKRATDAEMRREILDARSAIRRITGKEPRLFRFPFDEYDDRVVRILGECGLVGVSADVITGDPDSGISARRIASYTIETAQPGSIVLMHANGKGVNTAAALPRLIAGLRAEGFELVTVSELIGEPLQTQDP